jgi:outer membrane lipoprotein
MEESLKYYLSAFCILFLGACTNMPPAIRDYPATDIPYLLISQDINNYQGVPVRWGGTIIDVENEIDYSLAQILFYPLDRIGYPQINLASEGRFAVETSKFLDPAIFTADAEITITGTLKGEIERTVGNKTILIPLISADSIYLWPRGYYRGRRHYYGDRRHYMYPAYPYFGYYGYPPLFYRGQPYWSWW